MVSTNGESADFLTLDSDGDGTNDAVESGLTLSGSSTNGGGIDNALNATYLDPDGIINNPSVDLANQVGDSSEVAYREGAPGLSIDDIAITEGSAATVTVALLSVINEDVSIILNTVDGTAEANIDYQAGPYSTTISAGNMSSFILIPTIADGINEPDQTFTVVISQTTGGAIGNIADTATVTITDEDLLPDINIGNVSVTEGATATVPISLTTFSSTDITVTVQTVADTATSAVDFGPGPFTLVIPAETNAGTIAIASIDDNIAEAAEPLPSPLAALAVARSGRPPTSAS